MGKTIAICNQKGGTGKTTTSVNLSYALSTYGKKVLVADIDPQGNSTSGLGVNKNTLTATIYDVLLARKTAAEVIVENVYPGLDLLPCNINLTGAEVELVGVMSRENRLRKALAPVKDNYDFIFIDSPPSLGLLTLNALVACQSVLIPIQCEFYALEGVSQLLNTINLIKENLNPELEVEGVLMTMADFRTNLTHEVTDEIRGYFKDKVYKSTIHRNIKLSEAPSFGKPVIIYDPHSRGAIQYDALCKEFLEEKKYSATAIDHLTNEATSVKKELNLEKEKISEIQDVSAGGRQKDLLEEAVKAASKEESWDWLPSAEEIEKMDSNTGDKDN